MNSIMKRFIRFFRRAHAFAVSLPIIVLWLCGAIAPAAPEYRMLWVDVFHPGLRTPQEIDTMIATARRANYNAIIVQMRKACDAFYNSSVEPKNEAISADFDPLAYIIERAHDTSNGQKPLEVHAWLVAYRCRMPADNTWKNPRHIFQRHPEWLSQTISGAKEDKGENPGRFYLDPGVPAVIDYTAEVVRDIVSRYDIDGIHFDYIRYPESEGKGNPWGYNPIAVSRFNKIYGRSGKPAPDDPDWSDFRRRQVFHLVRRAYVEAHSLRPDIKVSAATIAWGNMGGDFTRTDAYSRIFQDWPAMLEAGVLDIAIPMNYKRESVPAQAAAHRAWARFLGQTAQSAGRFGVNGIDGETLNTLSDILAQMRATRSIPGIAGLANYCYAETRRGAPNPPDVEFFDAIRANVYQRWVAPPSASWLTSPSTGIVYGIATKSSGKPLDNALVRLASGEVTFTDGTGFFAFCRVRPGSNKVMLGSDAVGTAGENIDVRAGRMKEVRLVAQ